jgi:hypothetical protein
MEKLSLLTGTLSSMVVYTRQRMLAPLIKSTVPLHQKSWHIDCYCQWQSKPINTSS